MRSVIARGSCTDTIRLRELALEVDWEKNPCHTRDSSLCLYCACLFSQALSQLSYSQPFATVTALFCVHCSVRVTYAIAFVTVDWVAYCIDQHYTPSDPQDDKWHYATASLRATYVILSLYASAIADWAAYVSGQHYIHAGTVVAIVKCLGFILRWSARQVFVRLKISLPWRWLVTPLCDCETVCRL